MRAVEVPHSCAKNKNEHEWATPVIMATGPPAGKFYGRAGKGNFRASFAPPAFGRVEMSSTRLLLARSPILRGPASHVLVDLGDGLERLSCRLRCQPIESTHRPLVRGFTHDQKHQVIGGIGTGEHNRVTPASNTKR